jgi:hypothetical protein
MITGSGRVNLLSGQIRRYRVEFGSATRCAPVNLLGCNAGRLGRAGSARAVRPARPRHGFGPNVGFEIRFFFLFQIYFINYNQFEFKSNLNFNDFCSHNKI